MFGWSEIGWVCCTDNSQWLVTRQVLFWIPAPSRGHQNVLRLQKAVIYLWRNILLLFKKKNNKHSGWEWMNEKRMRDSYWFCSLTWSVMGGQSCVCETLLTGDCKMIGLSVGKSTAQLWRTEACRSGRSQTSPASETRLALTTAFSNSNCNNIFKRPIKKQRKWGWIEENCCAQIKVRGDLILLVNRQFKLLAFKQWC